MIKFFILLLVISVSSSCQQANRDVIASNKEAFRFPVIVDTSHRSMFTMSDAQEVFFPLLYIGPYLDTLKVDYSLRFRVGKEKKSDIFFDSNRADSIYFFDDIYIGFNQEDSIPEIGSNSNIHILIDTSYRFMHDLLETSDSSRLHLALPVLLINVGQDTVPISLGDFIPLSLESLNKKNEWKTIRSHVISCGTGRGHFWLPPHQVLLSALLIKDTGVKRTLRLKLGKNYSEVFYGCP